MAASNSTTLILVDPSGNHNKFYRVELLGDSDDGEVRTTWGRVGNKGVSRLISGGINAYERTIQAKERKGYQRVDVSSNNGMTEAAAQALISTDNSGTGGGKLNAIKKLLGIQKQPPSQERQGGLADTLRYVADANRHSIIDATSGSVNVADDGSLTTPLGRIGLRSIHEARELLEQITATQAGTEKREKLITRYLTRVPQKVGARGWADKLLTTPEEIQAQEELLRAMEASHAMSASSQEGQSMIQAVSEAFRCRLSPAEEQESKKVIDLYTSSASASHGLGDWEVHDVYRIDWDKETTDAFQNTSKHLGNVQQLWHGTDTGNVLSILHSGLYCPPYNSAAHRVVGRMYGDGIYLAPCSTKSLNYSTGFWRHRQVGNRAYLFLTEAALGNRYFPNKDPKGFSEYRARTGTNSKGEHFNSISVRGGTSVDSKRGVLSVANSEIIVWEPKQVLLRYLVEVRKK